MGHTLFISDLDGTLLNSKQQIPPRVKEKLKTLIDEREIHFSIATARTPATVELILEGVDIQDPIIVMNGTALYDLKQHSYIQVEKIEPDLVEQIVSVLDEWMKQGFIYAIKEDKLTVHYDILEGEGRINFYNERKNLFYKKFVKEPLQANEEVIYFMFLDTKENIQAIFNLLQGIRGIDMVMYKDLYSKEGYLLEIYSERATKANGIKKLRAYGDYQKVICFGDQLNDINMFHEADEAYAVSNAVEELKKLATAVIGSNEKGSVIQFIEVYINKENKEVHKC